MNRKAGGEAVITSWVIKHNPKEITFWSGWCSGIISNLTGIPFDKFRVKVAQDIESQIGLGSHLKKTFNGIAGSFTGGIARITMKSLAAMINLYVSPQLRADHPFLMSFAVGDILIGTLASPILNIPRMFQLGKISGTRYHHTFMQLFTSFKGLKTFFGNTVVFGPGEGFRMMMCFGTKDFIFPMLDKGVNINSINAPIQRAGRNALIVGPIVSAVETTAALVTETITTVHAHVKSLSGSSSHKGGQSFFSILRSLIKPKYIGRCWTSLFVKNCILKISYSLLLHSGMANTPLFWVMFLSDYYALMAKSNK